MIKTKYGSFQDEASFKLWCIATGHSFKVPKIHKKDEDILKMNNDYSLEERRRIKKEESKK